MALTPPDASRGHRPPGAPTPARRDPPVATTGEPDPSHPLTTGECRTPGYAAADLAAARGSTETVVDLGAGASSDPRPRLSQRAPTGNGVRPGVGLQDATYTRVCQQLATDWVYQMSYAEMDAWRWNKMLDRNYLRRHYSLDHDPDRDGAGGWPPIPAPIPPPPLPVPPGR